MGKFAETGNEDYRLLLADWENNILFSIFCLKKTNGSLPFPFFSVCSKQM
jgi:hypothetical protein